jgi:prepilin-type N-terminal cleavage/methylation domain-containing protein
VFGQYRKPGPISGHGIRHQGFALVEVLVAVVIIAIGLVFVFRSFSSSAQALRVSQEYTAAVELLSQVAEDLDAGRITVDSVQDSSIVINQTQFNLNAEPPKPAGFSAMGLQEIVVSVNWEAGRREFGYSILVEEQ